MLRDFSVYIRERHEYARRWKRATGGKVVGYLCTYVPEEIIYAAGMLPVRILGSAAPQDITERYLSSIFCPFSRAVLAAGLTNEYDYLDGVVLANTCLQIRQAFESWSTHRQAPFTYFLHFPYRTGFHAEEWLVGEFREFGAALEAFGKRPIANSSLEQAIAVYNKHREMLCRLYEQRRFDNPVVSGQEAMNIVLSGMVMDKAKHIGLLEAYEGSAAGSAKKPEGTRLMILGSETDDTQVIGLAEKLGGAIVVDDHCTGSRYFWNPVAKAEDPFVALARRYLERPPCPTKGVGDRRRVQHVLKLARDYRVKGAIFLHQKFCNPHQYDFPAVESALAAAGVPSLCLEMDVTPAWGQWQTRVEAFLEMLTQTV